MSAHGRRITTYERFQRHLTLAWYPISVSIVMFGLFSTFGLAAGQVQEALAHYVADRDQPWSGFEWIRAGISFLAIFGFAATMRYWTARLLGVDLRGLHIGGVLNNWQRVFIGIAWFAPWLGAALSFADAALPFLGARAAPDLNFAEDLIQLSAAIAQDPLQTPFTALSLACLVVSVLFLVLWWSPIARLTSRTIGRSPLVRGLHDWTLPGLFIGLSALFLAMPDQAIEFARKIGPVPIICISFAGLTAAGSWLIYFGRRHGLPAFASAAAAPLLLGALGLDDNHFIRTLAKEPRLQERPAVADALHAFAAEHGDAPIIFVSAEGGGVRSAHFTATVLARLADQCPRLARRVFLVSGVSGAAVGAAAYRASLEAMPLEGEGCDLSETRAPGPRQSALDEMFSRDHLSPTLAKQMFPEMLQLFLPASLPEGDSAFVAWTDRQRGLERSLEQAFAEAFAVDEATSPFAASVFTDPGDTPGAPHLLINMTETSSGGVFVASSLDLADMRDRHRWLHDFRCLWSDAQTGDDVEACNISPSYRLSTIAASSARFPIVSPAGSVRANDATFRFVDGGYFDNSGVEVVLAVVDHLQRDARARRQQLPPIAVLHIDSNPYQQRLPVKWRLDFDVHELQAVLATREERVRISLGRLYNMYQDRRLCSARFVEVADSGVPLRLGWILSNPAAEALNDQAATQLAAAFPNGAQAVCDDSESSAVHEASDAYAERLAISLAADP